MRRIAILAYACRIDAGSEPGAGYHWAIAAAKSAAVEIITRPLDPETRQALQSAGIAVNEIAVKHFQRIPQLSYIRWLLQAQAKLTELHVASPISLVHHITYANDWLPAPKLEGVPLVWGPVGGSTGLPKALGGLFSRKLLAKEAFRSCLTGTVRIFTRRWAKKNVDILIAQNQDTATNYSSVRQVFVRPNYVITPPAKEDFGSRQEKNIAIVGRLIEMKGVHIAISAMTSDALKEWTLHVIGDGPIRDRLQNQAKSLGVAERVLFHGQLPRDAVLKRLAKVRCSLLLSTHDAAGWSAAESISVGTPVHTWNHGGPAEIVRLTGCGTTTPPGPECVQELAEAIAGGAIHPGDVDLSSYYLENLSIELGNWYDNAIR